jgi:hypothetical protein
VQIVANTSLLIIIFFSSLSENHQVPVPEDSKRASTTQH